MADSYVDQVAGELADLALADQAASGDIGIVDLIAEVLGASSQTLQESYMTAIRVRRAEARARELLAQRKADSHAPAPLQGVTEPQDIPAADPEPTPALQDPQDPPAGGMPRRVTR